MTDKANAYNVFAGPNGLKNFLDPDYHLPTPLVELDAELNPFIESNVKIFAKLAYLSPLLTIKWNAAFHMLAEAHRKGGLKGVKRLVENSSGGTVFALAILARVIYDITDVEARVPADMAPGKLESLRLMDIKYVINTSNGPNGTELARIEGRRPGTFNPDQYSNVANWQAHEKWLGPQIWKQTEGRVSVYGAALGTTGTLIGPAKYFQQAQSKVAIVGILPTKDQVPGARTQQRIEADVKFDWLASVDHCVFIDPVEAYRKSLALWRRGIVAGPSSGLALAGIHSFLEEKRRDWKSLRNRDGEIVAVFPCADIAQLYAEKYSTHLDAADIA